ncbi:Pentatricopeptide repeat-containing protein [Quillaja saponaria]|uniref:Pentatricopeptide repeat-containing protein n=1 Tax=Quillaja saponaria TaxID=32244 RepID=A0AAD7PWK2_QUISA|nr:Pentatricopeptide repeat-containing protein [Quillaja saponaria]
MLSVKRVLLDWIQRCNNLRTFKQIHAHILTSGVATNDLVIGKVALFFGKYVDAIDYACDFLKHYDWGLSSFPCNMLISGYAASETPWKAVLVYRCTVRNGFIPDVYTFPAVLKCCAKFGGNVEIRQVHSMAFKTGYLGDMYVQNSLVHIYGICGDGVGAAKVFDEMLVRDVVSWTSMISGYVKAGLFNDAITLFSRMEVEPNVATVVTILVACGKMGYLTLGKVIHGLIIKRVHGKDLVVGNAVMDMYMKCESLYDAMQIFRELPKKDVIAWTSIIGGLVQCKRPKESLELFWEMQTKGFEPDAILLTSVLSACASLGALDYGRWVHDYIARRHIKWDIHLGTTMIDMYAKCGCVKMAQLTFSEIPFKNVTTWNALIGGLAMNGYGEEALKQFGGMIGSGIRPNEVTLLAVLTACCHSGLVDDGRRYFYQMTSQNYNLSPSLEHYGCMVDMLCKAGLLGEALGLIKKMPMPPDVQILGALLSACKAYGIIGLSKEILDFLQDLESQDSGVYVLLSNIYATNERWADVTRVRRLMKNKGIRKTPGSSLIEVDGKSHEFLVGDTSHPQSEDICLLLNILGNQVYLEGTVDTNS